MNPMIIFIVCKLKYNKSFLMTDAMAIRVAASKSIGMLNKVITLPHT